MLTDAGSLALALLAARLAARPPTGRFTFGLGRAEVLSAQVNGAALLVLAGVIAIEALQRFSQPPDRVSLRVRVEERVFGVDAHRRKRLTTWGPGSATRCPTPAR